MKHLRKMISLCVILALLLSLCPAVFAEETLPLTEKEWEVLLLTNRERLKENLQPVTATDVLQRACDIRGKEIAQKFSHDRPDGTECFSVLEDVGIQTYAAMGENIAEGYWTPAEVVDAWMHSEGHRENILTREFAHMGVGHYHSEKPNEDGISYYEYWVQFFYTSFNCGYETMNLQGPENLTVPVGTSIEDMKITAELNCRNCGKCWLPVMSEFCTGYDPDTEGVYTVKVSCFGLEDELTVTVGNPVRPGERYRDVHEKDWFYGNVEYVSEHGLMNGMENQSFVPNGETTRAMLVTILWRLEKEPEAGTNVFTDVKDGQWYTKAIVWANEAGVAGGIGDGKFDPEGTLTREQMATILFRYAGIKGVDVTGRAGLDGFPDKGQVSDWAEDALQWCVAEKIIGGSEGKLLPGGSATRAQVAAVLERFNENTLKK